MTSPSPTRLTRKVRLGLDGEAILARGAHNWSNNWIGGPAAERLVPRVELQVTIADTVDGRTGYVEDIVAVDHLVRRVVQQWLHECQPPHDPVLWLQEFGTRLRAAYGAH